VDRQGIDTVDDVVTGSSGDSPESAVAAGAGGETSVVAGALRQVGS
jgi:hypothetical protein